MVHSILQYLCGVPRYPKQSRRSKRPSNKQHYSEKVQPPLASELIPRSPFPVNENPSASPDYPSPSSPYLPPPGHEVKVQLPTIHQRTNSSKSGGEVPHIPSSDTGSQTTPKPSGSSKSEKHDPDDDSGPSRGRGEGMAAGRQRPISVPPHGEDYHIVDPTVSHPIPRTKHASLIGPRPGVPLAPVPLTDSTSASRAEPPRTPTTQAHASSSTHRAGRPNSLGDVLALLPDEKRSSLTSPRPAPHSPTPSRRQSRRISRLSTQMTSTPGLTPRRRTLTAEKKAPTFLMKIRDFAYSVTDKRHQEFRDVDLDNPPRAASPAPGGFLGPFSLEDERTAENESSPSQTSPSGLHYYEDPYSSQDEEEYDPNAPFTPGFYRALYDFDPQAPAEMALRDQQVVACIGRGGGDGWIVAVRGEKDGEVEHALVPAGYIEFVREFREGEYEKALGPLTPPPSAHP